MELDPQTPAQATTTSDTSLARFIIRRDPQLVSAYLICAAVVIFQLGMTLLQPSWSRPMNDWLGEALAWLEVAVVICVSVHFTRTRRPGAASWCMMSLALLSYLIARTWWTVDDLYIFPHGAPFPILLDLFYVLQYPFFFLAVILLPCVHPWVQRLRVIFDDLLWISAATALSWYFILEHMSLQGGGSLLGTIVNLAYPVGDLIVFSGLAVAITQPRRYRVDRSALYMLCAAFIYLFVGDSWSAVLMLVHSPHVHATDKSPDLYWTAFYALVALAGLVQLRLPRYKHPPSRRPRYRKLVPGLIQWRDVMVSVRALAPFVATLVAGAVIMLHAAITSSHGSVWMVPFVPIAVSLGLLLLATIRQVVASLDCELLRREQEIARAHRVALAEANRRMGEFLAIASHELKTPLTSLDGNIQLMARRLDTLPLAGGTPEDCAHAVALVRVLVKRCEPSLHRLGRLINGLLDDSCIHERQLELGFERCDLTSVVGAAVAEQRLLAPARTIQLVVPDAEPILVIADNTYLVQVVSNYLSNALKYSCEDQLVEVRVQMEGQMGRVSVRDNGVGLPFAEQEHIWERFHRALGVDVQSGSDVGLGIGLHICKTIVERHRGHVGVNSAPGRGSTFWFTVPLANTTP